jgi:hypothetical protein
MTNSQTEPQSRLAKALQRQAALASEAARNPAREEEYRRAVAEVEAATGGPHLANKAAAEKAQQRMNELEMMYPRLPSQIPDSDRHGDRCRVSGAQSADRRRMAPACESAHGG